MQPDHLLDAGETGCGELTLLIFQSMKKDDSMPKLLVNLTSAKNDMDKTTVAFVVANAGIAGGAAVVEFLGQGAASLSY